VWAAKNLALKAGEGKVLAGLFANSSTAFSNGIMVAGVKHLCIRADTRSVYGKKVSARCARLSSAGCVMFLLTRVERRSQGAGGVVLVKTGKCVLIGMYDDTIQPGQATTVVEKLGDYL
jgi:profilin